MDKRGLTMIELLGSLLIIGLLLQGFYHFHESYSIDRKKQHEYETAKNLAILVSEETLKGHEDGLYAGTGELNSRSFDLMNTLYTVTTTATDETSKVDVINGSVPMTRFNTVVNWKNKTLEVNAYVSE